jgi:hypothetical protein
MERQSNRELCVEELSTRRAVRAVLTAMHQIEGPIQSRAFLVGCAVERERRLTRQRDEPRLVNFGREWFRRAHLPDATPEEQVEWLCTPHALMPDGSPADTHPQSAQLQLIEVPAPSTFSDPVVVGLTSEQIDAGSVLYTTLVPSEEQCAVCQDVLGERQECRRLRHCSHSYHRSCIDPWLSSHTQCPMCRHDIRDQS